MMKPILAVVAALSLAIAGVGVAHKSQDGGKCQGNCCLNCPGDCGPEGCKGCDDGCGHGADKTNAKASVTSSGRLTKTKRVSLKGESGSECPGDCGPEGCKGCDRGCGHGQGKAKAVDKTEAKVNARAARVAVTSAGRS